MKKQIYIFLILTMLAPVKGYSQEEADDVNVIEVELDKSVPPTKEASSSELETGTEKEDEPAKKDNTLKDFSGLGTLAPFKEISIIQKRFLPKTGRFQLFGGGTVLTNNPFFNTIGGVAKASYFLSETWGVELNYFGLTTSERQTTQELRDVQGVSTANLVYPKSFVGLDLMYIPVYGKMTWFNEKIIPFDLYFSAGYGTTSTQAGESAGTLHLATGQIFAISKAYAFRWDFSWNFFNAKAIDNSQSSFNNLFLTVGMSWFFPEASYR